MSNIFPLVSILCATYNQEKFIAKTLESFIMQKTNFPFEIIVHDDASTDRTSHIVREYEAKFPHFFANIYQTENQFSKVIGNISKITFRAAKGKYIALCEGDDYWTDPYKLQKQVDFLEANEEYVLCFHKVDILETDGNLVKDYAMRVPQNHETITDLAKHDNYISTPSVVLKNVVKELPDEFLESPANDYILWMLAARYGKLKYIKETMAVYRKGVGLWSSQTGYEQNYLTCKIHILLYRYFYKNNNLEIAGVFLERIKYFLARFRDEINSRDIVNLVQLGINDASNQSNRFLTAVLGTSHKGNSAVVAAFIMNEMGIKTLISLVLKKIRRRLFFTL